MAKTDAEDLVAVSNYLKLIGWSQGGDEESSARALFRAGNWGRGMIGHLGNDVIFLQPEVISRFPNMASPDMFMAASSERIYLYIYSKFHEVAEGEAGLQKKLVEMDKQYFEQNP